MRQERTVQTTIFEVFAQHEIGCELKAMSQWLGDQPALVSLVAGDLLRQEVRETGRRGLPAESALRCALLKQQRQLSYEELAFHLEDSASFRASSVFVALVKVNKQCKLTDRKRDRLQRAIIGPGQIASCATHSQPRAILGENGRRFAGSRHQ
jgi:hypothetical protein